ncbi:MAG: hypothetical protein PHU85_10840, partial [Phycisphaerae bacterium]|nr:hypothetical protein [Phycisphaerae bacterium]
MEAKRTIVALLISAAAFFLWMHVISKWSFFDRLTPKPESQQTQTAGQPTSPPQPPPQPIL